MKVLVVDAFPSNQTGRRAYEEFRSILIEAFEPITYLDASDIEFMVRYLVLLFELLCIIWPAPPHASPHTRMDNHSRIHTRVTHMRAHAFSSGEDTRI